MSDCRFGVSPVNYPDPDPDMTEVLLKMPKLTVFIRPALEICLFAVLFSNCWVGR